MSKTNHKRIIICSTLIFLMVQQIEAKWYAAPAGTERSFEETTESNFTPLSGNRSTDLLLFTSQDGPEGWVWLRKELEDNASHILIHGPLANWDLWINGNYFGYYKPVNVPVIHDISQFKEEKKLTIHMRAYFRRGYAQAPPVPVAGNLNELQKKQLYSLINEPFIHLASILIGLLLIMCLLGKGKRDRSLRNMAFFGLFLMIANAGRMAVMFGWFTNEFWFVPSLAASFSVPLAVSFWRRTVTDSLGNRIVWISLVDFFVVTLLSSWIFMVQTGFALTPLLLNYDPLPTYVIMSVVAGLELWFYGLIMRWESRLSTALILLASLFVGILSLSNGSSPVDSIYSLINYGLPLSGLLCIVTAARKRLTIQNPQTGLQYSSSIVPENTEYLKPSENTFLDTVSDTIDRAIRLSFRNRKIPWDSHWDIAATNQITPTSLPGFHDFYISMDERIHGFSFFDSKQNNCKSTVFCQIVRSHLHRHFLAEASLIQLARGISQASHISTQTLRAKMEGLVASFNENSINILPIGKPAALLRRSLNGQIIHIIPEEKPPLNPEIGSASFGKNGIKTLKIPFLANDILLIYSPEIESLRSHTGKAIGREGVTELLRDSKGASTREILSDITKTIKQSIISMPSAPRLLVVRNKQGKAQT